MEFPIPNLEILKDRVDGVELYTSISGQRSLTEYLSALINKRYTLLNKLNGKAGFTLTTPKRARARELWWMTIEESLKSWNIFQFLSTHEDIDDSDTRTRRVTRNMAPFEEPPHPHVQEKGVILEAHEQLLIDKIRASFPGEVALNVSLLLCRFTHLPFRISSC